MDSDTALLVHQEECLNGRLELTTETKRERRVADERSVDDPTTRTHDVAMQVSLNGIVSLDGLIPLKEPAIQIRVRAVHSTEADCVAMVETNVVVIDLKVLMKSVTHDPLQIREPMREVVVHKELERVSLTRIEVKLLSNTAMISITAHDSDPLELTVIQQEIDSCFDLFLTECRLLNRLCDLRRHDCVEVKRAVDEIPTEEKHKLRDGDILPFLVGERHDGLEELRNPCLSDCHVERVET